MSGKTVFISYRRDAIGRQFGRNLKQALTKQGYDVFFDVDSIDAGKWEDQIQQQIPTRAHFLILLTPGALDRCSNPNDWVRREFELAFKSKRNIVPIREESFDVTSERGDADASMHELFDYTIVNVGSGSTFDADIGTLINRFIPEHKAPSEDADNSSCIVSPTRLHHGADRLFGREEELAALDQLAHDPTKKVLTIVAFGGVGKTSLVIEWLNRQAAKNWERWERVFDWSFFSQGTREKGDTASAEGFVAEALRFFGDEAMAQSAGSPWDKGARLAQLIARRRTLLVLDGVEPLQHPPGPSAGELKDPALATLLKSLARSNSGLCIVTTRERVADLAPFRDTTAPEWLLDHLSISAGVDLLSELGVRGTAAEFQQLVEKVKGHALTLNLLGRYLAKAHRGDISKSDQVKFAKADAATQGGYAFKTIGAYESWLSEGGEEGDRQLAVLRVLGLFDRPADAGCMAALRSKPIIDDLTEPLVGLDDDDWNLTLSSLSDCGLVSIQPDQSTIRNPQFAIDAHPLIREYFAKQLRENKPESWQVANGRLYEHLRGTTKEGPQPTLEDLRPLYQAVAHGCKAGLQAEVFRDLFDPRILRGDQTYVISRLGAFGIHLGGVSCFFEKQWTKVAEQLPADDQAKLFKEAAICLQALGRLREASVAMQEGLDNCVRREDWEFAATFALDLSLLDLTLGEVNQALSLATQSVKYARRSAKPISKMITQVIHGHALHQSGNRTKAEKHFNWIEKQRSKSEKSNPPYSLEAYFYCDLLLSEAETLAWKTFLGLEVPASKIESAISSCDAVSDRANEELENSKTNRWTRDIGLHQLTKRRAGLYKAILAKSDVRDTQSGIDDALDALRHAETTHLIPSGLLISAFLRGLIDQRTGPISAQNDLDEAWEIAERGPMRLHMADIHLYRARLFHAVKPYPWSKFSDGREGRGPKDDLDAAEKLINDCGYHRRDDELADAKLAILGET